jgi:SAM-dependent methyltransferase
MNKPTNASECPCCLEFSGKYLLNHKFKLTDTFRADYYACHNCGHIWYTADGRIHTDEYLIRYYKSKHYPLSTANAGAQNTLISIARLLAFGIPFQSERKLRVLEVGAGAGDFANTVINEFGRSIDVYYCNDPSTQTLPPNVTPVVDLKYFSNDPCDAVICRHTLEHIGNLSKFIDDISGALKPNGYLYIEVPCWTTPYTFADELNAEHIHQFNHTSIDALFYRHRSYELMFDFSSCFPEYFTPNRILGKIYRIKFPSDRTADVLVNPTLAFPAQIRKSRGRLSALRDCVSTWLEKGLAIGFHGATITTEDFFLNEARDLESDYDIRLYDGLAAKEGTICGGYSVRKPNSADAKTLDIIVCFSSYFREIGQQWRGLGFRGTFHYYLNVD